MFSILIINLLLGHFDNKLFFDEEYIKFLKNKNSFIQIKHKTIEPNYKFYKRITPEYKEDNKIKLFEVTPTPKPSIDILNLIRNDANRRQSESGSPYGLNTIAIPKPNFPRSK
jgi:hypothetical protein